MIPSAPNTMWEVEIKNDRDKFYETQKVILFYTKFLPPSRLLILTSSNSASAIRLDFEHSSPGLLQYSFLLSVSGLHSPFSREQSWMSHSL